MDDKQILVAARLKSHRINWYRRHEPLSDKILSGHELALRADISPSHLSTLEHGKKSPRRTPSRNWPQRSISRWPNCTTGTDSTSGI